MSTNPRIAIIGGGWAGLACALDLCQSGAQLDVFEASPLWGGRARAAEFTLAGERIRLDCGQHLLVGAYQHCLDLIASLGPASANGLLRQPLHLDSPAGFELRRARLPGSAGLALGLARARGLSPAEKWAAARMMARLRFGGWRVPPPATTVSELLAAQRQPARLVQRLWEPLCIGALNTRLELACAASFVAVLRDTLGAAARASDLILTAVPLEQLFSEPALERLRGAGIGLHERTRVTALKDSPRGWQLEVAGMPPDTESGYEQVVIATDACSAARLLAPLAPGPASRLDEFRYAPIATAYLGWRQDVRLPAVSMLAEDRENGQPAQWIFDRGRQAGLRLAGVVVSARDRLADLDNAQLAAAVSAQVAHQLQLPPPDDARVLSERRATWQCVPHRPRLACDALRAHAPGLWLAGDYLDPEYPATLEAAVRCGQDVAGRIHATRSGRDGPAGAARAR